MLMFQNESSSKNISYETNLNWSFSKTTFVKKSPLNKDCYYFFIIFFLLRENKPVGRTHFQVNGFTQHSF